MNEAITKAAPKAAAAGRSAAPRVSVNVGHVDHRARILNELSEKDPDHVYMYQRPNPTDWELKTKGQEVVKDDKGEVIHHKGDPVVRVRKEQVEEERQYEAELSRNAVESVVDINKSTVERSPKKPMKPKERK
ncbi:MAG: hypothetical protein E6R03_12250 [Hyphomicrobiaceae bacterium]|nr:MAG: hypothetical protein E6R03_12250 [Hyphomicrobiaceae bacterium]